MRYRRALKNALKAVRENAQPEPDALAWPAGLDRTLLLGLPLAERTRSAVLWAGLMQGDNPLTVHALLRTPNVGGRAIRDLVLATDEFLGEYIERFEGTPTPAGVVAMRLAKQVERLTPRGCAIVEHRTLRQPPMTLALLGRVFTVSGTRVGHIQERAECRTKVAFGSELRGIAAAAKDDLGDMREARPVHRRLDALLPHELGSRHELIRKLFRRALTDEMGFRLDEGVYVEISTDLLVAPGLPR